MRTRAILLLLLFGLLASATAHAQESILEFSMFPEPLQVAVGGRALLTIEIENQSAHEADDVEVIWAAGVGVAPEEPLEPIDSIAAFSDGLVHSIVAADPSLEAGIVAVPIEIIYTYCIGELCFQIVEPLELMIDIVEAPEEQPDVVVPPPTTEPDFPWEAGAGALTLLLLLAAGILRRTGRAPWLVVLLIAIVAVGAITVGVLDGQHEQAQGIGAVLCTSCVGLEIARTEEPTLSPEAIEALETITEEIELIVFSAPWCHACPYAKGLVALMAESCDRISYVVSDVDEEPELAELHGVIRSNRTVVPAVLRVDTGEVVFGVENLEARLLEMFGRPE